MKESYESPQLKEIGTVAELTKGAGAEFPENMGSSPFPAPG